MPTTSATCVGYRYSNVPSTVTKTINSGLSLWYAQISPSLLRNLSSGGTVTINVIEPGTLYPDRTNQLDARLAKTFAMTGGRRLQALFDVYNVFNSNVALRLNGAYGANGVGWGTPQAIVPGRLVKFGAQLRF